jgi:hypothetical protein
METTDFQEIFNRIKKLLLPYGKKMETRVDAAGQYQLYIIKDIELGGRKFSECYFGGTVIQKTMVAFYFFPIYTHPKEFMLPDSIKKNLKGKSCFNFKKLNEGQEKAIAALLKEGAGLYKKGMIL